MAVPVWRGHSCPRNLTTSTADNFHFETPLSRKNSGIAGSMFFSVLRWESRKVLAVIPKATFRRYEYRRRQPHYQRDDRPLFVTFPARTGFELSPTARTLTLQHCLHDNGKTLQMHAVVIMRDHVHLLFTALRDTDGWTFSLPEILRAIKGSSARSINKLSRRTGPVWQDESFDHVLRGEESLSETIEYIRQNPARKGLVRKPEDYQWLWVECGAGTAAREI